MNSPPPTKVYVFSCNHGIADSSSVAQECFELLEQVRPLIPMMDCEGTKNVWICKPGALSRGRGGWVTHVQFPAFLQIKTAANSFINVLAAANSFINVLAGVLFERTQLNDSWAALDTWSMINYSWLFIGSCRWFLNEVK